LDEDTIFQMMRMAHERDITLNELVEQALRHAIGMKELASD
jgi:predicted HicB family RNase H-like nuclease